MAQNAQHTPGPWEIKAGTFTGWERSSICTVYSTENMPTEDGLGAMYATIVGPFHGDNFQSEQTANARLIAAAPELLEALKIIEIELRSAANAKNLDEKHFERDYPQSYAAWKQARAAIAKASGQAA